MQCLFSQGCSIALPGLLSSHSHVRACAFVFLSVHQNPACIGFIFQAENKACHLKSSAVDINVCATTTDDQAPPSCSPCALVRPPAPVPPAPPGAKNVLFLVSDDFRPSSGKYGVKESVTPNLDALANSGILFAHAYVQ